MLSSTGLLLLFLASLYYIIIITKQKTNKNGKKYPPGPKSLPIIGNLHLLGSLPHRDLQQLAQKHGPIMLLWFGQVPTIVISSPKAAELILKTHDTVFANRPRVEAALYMSHGNKSMAFGEYGPYWRNLRKLCIIELLCPSKMESNVVLRREEVDKFVKSLKVAGESEDVVNLSEKVSEVIEDITFKMVFGTNNTDKDDLKGLVTETLRLLGAFNLNDYVPYISFLDLQGLKRQFKKIKKGVDQMLEKIIVKHEQVTNHDQQDKGNNIQKRDFVDVLLSLINQPINPQDEQVFTFDRTNLKAILFDMISASFDTSTASIEWTLSELVRNPRVMTQLQEELQSVIGLNQMVEEKDLCKLPYLDMVVKESFRLHPVAPFLLPHESREDITIEGYYIPKKSRVLINTWAIGHDPKVWSDNVEEFYPERFKNSNIDLRGQDFRLTPFGSGRRGCPGLQLGLTTTKFVIAQLVHCFNWELPIGMKPCDINMIETFGLTMLKANNLFARPRYRLLV